MTRNILIGKNIHTGDLCYKACEVFSSPLVVGGTYKGETIREVEPFIQPIPTNEYTCQMVTTSHYHEIVVVVKDK